MAKWISHRGESYDAPENTLAAFRLSMERDSDGMECDVHLTADGKVVVCHDSHTARMGDRFIKVEDSTFEEVRKVNVSGAFDKKYPDERIPLLEETFQYLGKDREFYIELKGENPALIPAVADIVRNSGIPHEQIVFISFSGKLLKAIKKAMPEYRTLFLDNLFREHGRATTLEILQEIEEFNADGIDAACHPELDAELVNAVHQAGKIFAVWTVDNPFTAKKLLDYGVDAITSNQAALLKNW